MPAPSLRYAKANRLLATLPQGSLERMLPDLERRPLTNRQVLQKRGERLEEAVFPVIGVASMVSLATAGDSVEVATIGCEGFVGLPLFLGDDKAAVEVFVQVPGEALYVSATAFKYHLEREPTLSKTLLRYAQALLTQVAQCSACNVYHTMEARCARWLLQTDDRMSNGAFPLTHEFLGLMLGVRRATVTEAAGALQKRKLIRYSRGVIEVLNRRGLEAAACDCYRLINDEYERLLGPISKRSSQA